MNEVTEYINSSMSLFSVITGLPDIIKWTILPLVFFPGLLLYRMTGSVIALILFNFGITISLVFLEIIPVWLGVVIGAVSITAFFYFSHYDTGQWNIEDNNNKEDNNKHKNLWDTVKTKEGNYINIKNSFKYIYVYDHNRNTGTVTIKKRKIHDDGYIYIDNMKCIKMYPQDIVINEKGQKCIHINEDCDILNYFSNLGRDITEDALFKESIETAKGYVNIFDSITLNSTDSINKGAFNVPNQLIQKPRDDSKNLCPTCLKKDICNDYKILKYSDDCDSYEYNISPLPFIKKKIEVKVSIDLEDKISKELYELKFEKGIRVLGKLKTEITGVKDIFEGSEVQNNKFVDIDKTKKITEDIYNKSLNFLSLATEIYKQVNATGYEELKKENGELQESLKNCKDENSALNKILVEAISKNNKVLEIIKRNKDKIDELFAQISLCKDAIMEIRLGLPEMINHQSTDEINEMIKEGKDRIEFGQRLLEEFKSQGL